MKRRIISVLFLLAVFLPSVSSASILTDTALGFGDFYKDSIEESSLETLHVVDSVKDFYSPIIYNSIDIYTSIGVEVTAVFDGVADVVESIGNTFLLSFALGLENTGNTVGNVAMVYNDTLSKANAEISNLSNVSSSVSGNFFGVLKNIPVSFAETFVFVGQATIDTYTDVIIKAGNGVGSALYEGSVFADDLFEDASEATEKVYSDTEALGNVVIESHDYVVTKTGDSLVELYINSSSKINDVSSVANKKVTDTSREYLASIGSVWTNFIDKLSEPLVPLFMHEAAVAVPGFKNTKAVTKTVDDSTEIISQGNPNAINTNIIQRLSGISRLELNSSLLDMKNEIISIILQNKLSFSESQLEKIYNSIGKTAERTDGGNSGTVTSIDASGGTTGFSFSGGPVTSAGTLTLGGILNIANGGTGTSTSPTYGQLLLGNSSGTYDLVATSSLGITSGGGTVSSVDLSVPTGLSVSGGPITSSGTLAVTLTSGYNIPLTASTTEWNTAYASTTNLTTFWSTPSTRITAGTGLSWSGNTLNSTGVTSIGGLTGVVATSSLGIIESQWTTSGSNISYSTGNVGIGTTTPDAALTIADSQGLSIFQSVVDGGQPMVAIDSTGSTFYDSARFNSHLRVYDENADILFRVDSVDKYAQVRDGSLIINGDNAVFDFGGLSLNEDNTDPFYLSVSEDLLASNFLTNTFSGNVGIGTTTPGYALTVAGDISLTGALRANGNAGTSGMVLQTTGTGVQWVATSSLGIPSQWTTTGSDVYYNTGNVGIGSTTPGSKLTVSGNTFIGGTLTATGTVSVAALITGTVASAPTIDFGSDMSNVLMVSGGTGGRVVGFGNMGGGHMALRVSSGAFIEWSVPNDPRQGVDTAFQRLAAGKIGLGNGTSNDISGTLVLGNLGIGTTTPSAKFAITGNGASTGRALVVANSSNVDKFIVDDSGSATLAGSLTIGTTLVRTGQGTFFDGNNFTALGANAGFRSNGGNTTLGNASNAYLFTLRESYGLFGASTASIGFTSATSYSGTLDTAISRISAGVVGVGTGAQGSTAGTLLATTIGIATTTPGYALTVAGDISLTGTLRANGNAGTSGMVLQTTGTGVQWVATSSLGITGGGGSLTGTTGQVAYFSGTDTAVGTSSLFIATSGNMGVGTASPSARIHSLSTTEQLRLGYDASNYTKFTVGSASGLTVTPGVNGTSAFNFTKADGTTSILNVDSTNEYVGIGTSASGAKLDVYSATNGLATLRLEHTFGKYGATSPFLRFKYGSDSFLTDIYTGTFNQFTIDHSGSDMYIFTDSNRNMSLQKDGGNLGIGETSPGSILSVSGGGTFGASYDTTASPANGLLVEGNVGIGTITPSAKLSLTQSANTNAGGLWIAETGNTDFRSIFMNTSGVMSFYGGDTGGTLNTATLNAAGEWTNASDRAYKDNINDLSYGLEDLMKLQPRSYTIKNTDLQRVGFIAQEVELVIPEVVAGEEGTKGISYGNLVTVVVKAVQELKIQLDTILLWFADGKFKIQNDICVDDVCVTKEQFKQILLNNNGGTNSPTPTPDEAPDNTGTTTSETVPPEETPDIEPDPVPAVTPTPDSTPIPEISPDPEPVPDEVPPPEETSTE